MWKLIEYKRYEITRDHIDRELGTVTYTLVYDEEDSLQYKAHVFNETVCSGWLLIGREKELDAEMIRRLKFSLWRKTGVTL